LKKCPEKEQLRFKGHAELCRLMEAAHAAGDTERMFAAIYAAAIKAHNDEDVASQICLAIWRRHSRNPITHGIANYVTYVIRNAPAQIIAKAKKNQPFQLLDTYDGTHDEPYSDHPEFARHEPDFPTKRARVAFELKVSGRSDREIAAELGVTVNAAKSLMKRARRIKSRRDTNDATRCFLGVESVSQRL
jgi:DNA-directed RNA polymerase specialized sigma24 family protein